MKKLILCLTTLMCIVCLSSKSASAHSCINRKRDYVQRSGSFVLAIIGPSGTQQVKITLKPSTTNYNTLITKSISVAVTPSYVTTNLYNVQCHTSSASTKIDDEGNYTIVVLDFSYTLPAHATFTKTLYDKCDERGLKARMNFNTYTPNNDSTNCTLYPTHSSSAQTISFQAQVNLAQAGVKTVSGYLITSTMMGFYIGYPSYTLYFNENGGSDVSDITQTCGSVVSSLPATSKAYYNFIGWYENGNKVDSVSLCGRNVYLTAYYSPVNYSISYDLDGGSANNPSTYNCEQSFTLNNPTKKKYEFIGWTGSNGSTPVKNLTIPRGSSGNKTYTANYKRIYTPPTLNAYDRYVFVNQEIDKDNLLNSVSAYDEDDIDISDQIILESIDYGSYKDNNVSSLDTSSPGTYTVTFKVTDKLKLTSTKTIHVYVVEDTTSYTKTNYRFINKNFLNTIHQNSVWQENTQYQKLLDSLNATHPYKTYQL